MLISVSRTTSGVPSRIWIEEKRVTWRIAAMKMSRATLAISSSWRISGALTLPGFRDEHEHRLERAEVDPRAQLHLPVEVDVVLGGAADDADRDPSRIERGQRADPP